MNNLTTNINQAISDFNNIKQAIINKGVIVPQGTHTSQYAELINNISGGGNSTMSEFDMTGITAYFSPENIDIPNLQWINAIEGGDNLTFTAGELSDNALMIPGNENGQFPLANIPEVIYAVVKKPVTENDRAIIGIEGNSVDITLYNLNNTLYFYLSNGGTAATITNIVNKYYLITAVSDYNSAKTFFGFFNGIFYGQKNGFNISNTYTGNVSLNCLKRNGSIQYLCTKSTYFKFIACGRLPSDRDRPLSYMSKIYNNMDWLMKNVVNPANEEV